MIEDLSSLILEIRLVNLKNFCFFQFEDSFEFTSASADVFLYFLRAIAVTVFPHQFRLRGRTAVGAFNSTHSSSPTLLDFCLL